jgi:hypothetical protein
MEFLRMPVPRLDVEEAIARVVRGAGGEIVSDLLPARANRPNNADYLFRGYNVIAELKRLEEDHDESEEFREKRNQLYRTWINQRKVLPTFGTMSIELRNLPLDCALEMISLYREPIRNRISGANKQIRSTKKLFNMENAKGLLIFVHDGDYSITPEAVLSLSHRCMKGGFYSSINDLVYTSGNMLATKPGDPLGYQFFFHCPRDMQRPIPAVLINKLNIGWQKELSEKFGTPTKFVVNPPNIWEDIDKLHYKKP